jgi:hypothetical protein
MPFLQPRLQTRFGGTFDEDAFFRGNPHDRGKYACPRESRARCIGCELTARNEPGPTGEDLDRRGKIHHVSTTTDTLGQPARKRLEATGALLQSTKRLGKDGGPHDLVQAQERGDPRGA